MTSRTRNYFRRLPIRITSPAFVGPRAAQTELDAKGRLDTVNA